MNFLLNQVLKSSSKEDEDFQNLVAAKDLIVSLCNFINREKKIADEIALANELQACILEFPTSLKNPKRRVLHSGILNLYQDDSVRNAYHKLKQKIKLEESHSSQKKVILFNDIIVHLIVHQKEEPSQKTKPHNLYVFEKGYYVFSIEEIKDLDDDPNGQRNSFCINNWIYVTSSPDEKKKWLTILRDAHKNSTPSNEEDDRLDWSKEMKLMKDDLKDDLESMKEFVKKAKSTPQKLFGKYKQDP